MALSATLESQVDLDKAFKNMANSQEDILSTPLDADAQLQTFDRVARFLPEADEHVRFWWAITGRQVARMLYEARYAEARQVELLLFFRFVVVPRLGPRPRSSQPAFRSRVAPGVGDGSPIGYSWRWGLGPGSQPRIRLYTEPMGPLTGTPADPLNETAAKEMLWALGQLLPESTDLSLLWPFAAHTRPSLTDARARAAAGSSMLVGLEWAADNTTDVSVTFTTRTPNQVSHMLDSVFPAAMADAYGADASTAGLQAVRDFLVTDLEHGSQLSVLGTTAIDCCRPALLSRFKIYATTRRACFDHIAAVMTLGGRRPVSARALEQLRTLWYSIKGLEASFPSDAEPPAMAGQTGQSNGHANISGLTFYFDVHPRNTVPHVKMQIDVSKHAASDLAAITAVNRFVAARGQAADAQAYVNVLRGMVGDAELRTKKGLQAVYAFAIKGEDIDITSYFLPQAYRRYSALEAELSGKTQHRSRFDSSY